METANPDDLYFLAVRQHVWENEDGTETRVAICGVCEMPLPEGTISGRIYDEKAGTMVVCHDECGPPEKAGEWKKGIQP